MAAPTARIVNTAQVRSGHLGSASKSLSGSDMAFRPPVVPWHVRYGHRRGSDTASTYLLRARTKLRMLINFSNARNGCTRVGARACEGLACAGNHVCRDGAIATQR